MSDKTEIERAEFEEWIKIGTHGLSHVFRDTSRMYDGQVYVSWYVQIAWLAWQAARKVKP